MVRAFVAVDISDEARGALGEVIENLRRQPGTDGVRWVRPENIHLTLKFLGEIPESQVATILAALERAARESGTLNLALSEVGAFPNIRGPRVVWIGVKEDVGPLKELAGRVDQEIHVSTGLSLEKRAFSPHLTLGRVRDTASGDQRRRIGQALTEVALEAEVSWKVSEVKLIRSTLKPSGAVYDALGSCPL